MLSSVLRSERAAQVNIVIIRAFIEFRCMLTEDWERLAGSAVLSRSTMELTDGTIRDVAAIDFTTNPMGYEFNSAENFLGVKALSQEGTSTFLVQDPNGAVINIADMGVTNVYGGKGNDIIIGGAADDALSGSDGDGNSHATSGDVFYRLAA